MVPGVPQASVGAEVYYPLASDEAGLEFLQVPVGALLGAILDHPLAWEPQDATQEVGWAFLDVHLPDQDEEASA